MNKIIDVQGRSIEEYELKFLPYDSAAKQLSSGAFFPSSLIIFFWGGCSFGIRSVSQDIEDYAYTPTKSTLRLPKKTPSKGIIKKHATKILTKLRPKTSHIAAEHCMIHFGNYSRSFSLLYGEKSSGTIKQLRLIPSHQA